MSHLGKQIKTIRKKKNMTQKTLAEKICSQSVLSRIENGEEIPNAIVLYQLCKRLGITVEQVLSDNVKNISAHTETLKTLQILFEHNQYAELANYLEQSNCINEFHEDTDLQFYYYCLGSCRYYLDHDYLAALDDLQMALEFTYSPNNHYYTNYEILILSCIGKVHYALGQEQEAFYYLHESLGGIDRVSINENSYLLTRIFYNLASTHTINGNYAEAQIYLEKGLSFANDLNNSYYLADLIHERAVIAYLQRNLQLAVADIEIAISVALAVGNQGLVTEMQQELGQWQGK